MSWAQFMLGSVALGLAVRPLRGGSVLLVIRYERIELFCSLWVLLLVGLMVVLLSVARV